MKASMLMKNVAALAVGAAFAISPSGETAQRGVIEKVNPPRKQFAHNWLDS
jgi:hypothetical protein